MSYKKEIEKLLSESTWTIWQTKVKTDELVKHFVGKIRGYDLSGDDIHYYQQDGDPYYIDGGEIVDAYLEELDAVRDYKRDQRNGIHTITFDLKKVVDFMVGSGFRTDDYSEQDAKDELQHWVSALAIISSMADEYGIRKDPYKFQYEDQTATVDE